MAKNYGKCALCNSKKFLNFAGLCKRCNRTKASTQIIEEVMKKKEQENLAAQKRLEEQQARELLEAEEKGEEVQEAEGEEEKEGKEEADAVPAGEDK